jgi:H+/Cl- antiporter ClcA
MQNKFKWCGYAILSGVLAGLAASLFLITLAFVTDYRIAHPEMVFGLPLAGLLIGLIYHYYGKEIQPGTTLILDEIHDPKKTTPIRLAPAIFVTTILTHLFGGSAGREGTAVQMGASLSDQLSRFFKISHEERKILLVSGAGAGFGAALGAPTAGIFFGMEIMRRKQTLKPFALVECTIASLCAYLVTKLTHAPHTTFPSLEIHFSLAAVGWTLIAAISFGLIARFFLIVDHHVEKLFSKFIAYPPLKPLVGGILLLILFKGFSLEAYEGLGLDIIQRAIREPLPASVFIIKLLLTALTLGSGFKGGEFIPLIFMGATSGSFLGGLSTLSTPLLPSLGCIAVFAAASKTPFSCSIMAIELFGFEIAPYAIVACFLSSAINGSKTIYRKQGHESKF